MGEAKNVVICQSGGPTAVINNSLRAVIETCREYPEVFGTVYGAFHGVEGIMTEKLVNLSAQPKEEVALLRTTPTAGYIGSCRYKLKEHNTEDFDRVLDVLTAHDVGYLFYIGGNDTMDTANKISMLARERGHGLVATGVPKTIDNDVGDSEFTLIDHTPGYGSVARYWANMVSMVNEENKGTFGFGPVLVLQAMGRKIGYITAAARLADPNREIPMRIYMAESNYTLDEIADDVNDLLKEKKRAIVVVSEGLNVGDLGASIDQFGHPQFGASQMTVAQKIVNHLNDVGLVTKGKAKGQVPGTDQRGNIISASNVDLDEAYALGQQAVKIAMENGNGYMSTILRNPTRYYSIRYDKVALSLVANSERTFPTQWLNEKKIDVTDEFIKYAKPANGNKNAIVYSHEAQPGIGVNFLMLNKKEKSLLKITNAVAP